MRTPLALLFALLVPQSAPQESGASAEPEAPGAAPVLEAFDLDALARELTEGGQRWSGFLDRPTLSAGLYRLPAGAEDGQGPHAEDEVYHVVRGRAVLEVGDRRTPAVPGAVLFVAAGAEHRFVDVEEDLEVLVFFSKAAPRVPAGTGDER
jgi:quercetin dioxygenase-like cupin family protein